MIVWLDNADTPFPPPEQALEHPDGLLAAGGGLSAQRLLSAYRQGIFPWYNPGEPILWWSPNPRCTIQPADLHISRSLRKQLLREDYAVTFDRAFIDVIKACAATRSQQSGTWISTEIMAAYTRLHQQGIAHSVEVWRDDELIGGLYGLGIGSLFFGESMFSRADNASKIAFSYLCVQLQQWQFQLIDCQVYNSHLESLGARLMPRDEFLGILVHHLDDPEPEIWQFNVNARQVAGKTL